MSLAVVEIRELRDFTLGFMNAIVGRDAPPIGNDLSTGFNLGIADGGNSSVTVSSGVYDHIRDRILTRTSIPKHAPGFLVRIREGLYMRDALCLNPSIGWFADTVFAYTNILGGVWAGQPNLQTGSQKFYASNTPNDHFEINPVDGSIAASDIFPLLTGNNHFDISVATTGNAGYYLNTPTSNKFNGIFFEGMTSSLGYSEITIGGSSHAKGLLLRRVSQANFDGGANTAGRWVWIDPDTNNVVGFLNVPVFMDSTSQDDQAEPTLNNRPTEWDRVQFVPDEGTTFAQPKGELHMFSTERGIDAAFELNLTVTSPEETFSSLVLRNFVTVYDFNPFDSQVGVVRVHNRRIFLGIADVPQEPIMDGGPDMTDAQDNENNRTVSLVYHPPSRTYLNTVGRPLNAAQDSLDAPEALHSRIIRLRRTTVVDRVSQPTPESAVTEERTIRARVIAHTDVGARAISASVSFVLSRLTTRAESFDGTALGSGTYAVAAAEIDEDGTLDVRHTNDVDNGGTLLVEGVDYSVVYATGVLTPLPTNWPTQTIFVRYRHRQVKLTPPHGTLLNTTATTDGNGVAFASVRYGGNVDAEIDTMQVTVAV